MESSKPASLILSLSLSLKKGWRILNGDGDGAKEREAQQLRMSNRGGGGMLGSHHHLQQHHHHHHHSNPNNKPEWLQQYDLIGKIGEGTYGLVFLARIKPPSPNRGKSIAIKKFKQSKDGDGVSPTAIREIMVYSPSLSIRSFC